MNKKRIYPFVFTIALICYTIFTLLDAFVIVQDVVYVETISAYDETEILNTNDDISDNTSNVTITDTSYVSEDISITISTYYEYDTTIYVADVVVSDSSYLKAGLAGNAFGRNLKESTSTIANNNNAILAINGDFYGFRDSGYVMRNGYLYRDTAQSGSDNEDLVIFEDGSFEIVNESQVDAQSLADNGAFQIFSFGPGLVIDGQVSVDVNSEVDQSKTSNPRTAIGIIESNHYIFLVSDGRSDESQGLTLYQLASFMQTLGCTTAYNLDGGGSSTMVFNGEVINNPTSGNRSGERSVSDIVYIG